MNIDEKIITVMLFVAGILLAAIGVLSFVVSVLFNFLFLGGVAILCFLVSGFLIAECIMHIREVKSHVRGE